MEFNYTPIHETTRKFHLSNAFARWLRGPLGSGKSFAICYEILIRAAQQPLSKYGTRRSKVIFVRGSRQQLVDTVLPILQSVFPENIMGHWRVTDSTYQIRLGNIECDILLRALEDEADIKRVLSINATFCVVDEWREIPVTIINDIAGRGGRFPAMEEEGCAYSGIFGASNSPGEDSEWYEKLEMDCPEGWETFVFPSARSPEATWRKFLQPGYYERLIAGGTPDYIRVMIDNQYGRSLAGRPVYEETFNQDFHVAVEKLSYVKDRQYPIVIGLDFGRTPAAVFGQRDAMGRVLILSEIYQENIGLERFVQDHIKPHINQYYSGMPIRVIGDPAGWAKTQINELNCADILNANKLPNEKAPTNDPTMRIEAVERLLARQIDGKAYYLIDSSCKMLIRGFKGGYKYKRRTDGSYEPSPQKTGKGGEYSHIHDANQYLVCGIDGLGGGYSDAKKRKVNKASYKYV